MARNSAVNLDITNNAVGATIGGGATTERYFAWNGTGNITLTQAYSGNTVFTLPNAGGATDFLLGASAFTAAGTILYGTGVGTYPLALAAGTPGQVLEFTGTTIPIAWASPALLTWIGINGAQLGAAQTGYYVTAGNQVLTLPATAAAGTYLAIYAAKGSTGWSIVQGSGQSIQFGSASTGLGSLGSLASNAVGDGVILLCTTANTTWLVTSSIGNLTIS